MDVMPEWHGADAHKTTVDVPWCQERCPSFDGKRCEQMGFKPETVCTPVVQEIVRLALRSAERPLPEGMREHPSVEG